MFHETTSSDVLIRLKVFQLSQISRFRDIATVVTIQSSLEAFRFLSWYNYSSCGVLIYLYSYLLVKKREIQIDKYTNKCF